MEKIFAKLFVFVAAVSAPALALASESGGGAAAEFLDKLLAPLGMLTFILLASTLALGLKMSKNRKVFFKWHRILAFVTIAVAACHGLLVFTVEYIL